tara:strand:- start:574 stop:780 length:207 start_codon:yes stop_codon:yes gene_type:complete
MSMSRKHFNDLAEVMVEIKQTSESFVTRRELVDNMEAKIKRFCQRHNSGFRPDRWDNFVTKLLTKAIH